MGSIATQNNTKWPGFCSLHNQFAGFPITGVLLDIAQDKTSYCPMSMWSHTWHVKNTKCMYPCSCTSYTFDSDSRHTHEFVFAISAMLSLICLPVVKKAGVVPRRFCRQVGFGRSNARATTISSLAQPFLELDHLFVVFIRVPIGFPW